MIQIRLLGVVKWHEMTNLNILVFMATYPIYMCVYAYMKVGQELTWRVNFATKGRTVTVIISVESIVEWVVYVSSGGTKSGRPHIYSFSRGGSSCDVMGDNTGHGRHSTGNRTACPVVWSLCQLWQEPSGKYSYCTTVRFELFLLGVKINNSKCVCGPG